MDFSIPEELAELERQCRRFAEKQLRPRQREVEQTGELAPAVMSAFDSLGLSGLMLPESLGGSADALAAVVALEAVAWGDAGALMALDQVGPAGGALAAWQSHSGGHSYGGGRLVLAMAEQTGATLPEQPPRDSEQPARDSEQLTGVSGEPAGGLVVPYAPGDGLPEALFVLGSTTLAMYPPDALEVSSTRAGAFDACGGMRVEVRDPRAAEMVAIGPSESLAIRARAWSWSSAVLLGIAQASLDHAVAYGRDRIVFGTPVLGHQANAFDLAGAYSGVEAARLATRSAAWRLGMAGPSDAAGGPWLAGLAYLEALRSSLVATDLGVQLLGGHGYMVDEPVEKYWREVRALSLLWGGEGGALDCLAAEVLTSADPLVVPG